MFSIEEAQRTILETIILLEAKEVPLFQALNRVTSEDQIAPWDLPPADYSAMDGYAFCHSALTGNGLKVGGFLPAGEIWNSEVARGEAIRIMTGAFIPPGCDTVVPIEDVKEEGGRVMMEPVQVGTNVRKRGEDIRCGNVVIPAGSLVRPQEISMLAAMGRTTVAVHRPARVAILSTGDELLEPGSPPVPGKIINSNSYGLAAQVLEAGATPVMLGIAADDLQATCDKIASGLDADLVVISGGASVGDKDFVKPAIERLGGSINFWKVDMKPGKPLAFGMVQRTPVFALPGNPVAAMVSFELFVRPAFLKAMGHRRILRPTVSAILQEPASNKGARPHMVRGIVSRHDGRYYVSTTGNQSSGRLSSLIEGNGLIRLAPQSSHGAQETVQVLLLDRNFEMEGSPQKPALTEAA